MEAPWRDAGVGDRSMLISAHMALDKRLQVLVDDDLLTRLRRESQLTGAPVGAIVRDAIDHRLGRGDEPGRRAAFRALLDELPPDGAEPDWEVVKAEMLDERAGRHKTPPA